MHIFRSIKFFLLKTLCFCLRGVLSLRYKVELRGEDSLRFQDAKKKGLLLLPNHPANIDPIILYLYLWPKFQMRPLVVEYIYRQRFLRWLMRLVRALPIPNLETSINELKIKKAATSLDLAVEGLEKGDAFLIYPAGRLKKTNREILGGASGVHTLLMRVPDVRLVLIRTTGLWGSSFSRALEHRSPDLKKTFFQGFKVLLKNGIFFCKRRRVLIEIAANPAHFPRKGSRLEINRFLEEWYNRYHTKDGYVQEEPLSLVSYAFYRKVYPEVQECKKRAKDATHPGLSVEEKKDIFAEIAQITKLEEEKIEETMNLALDLGMDSLDVAGLAGYLADHFDIGDISPEDIETVQDVLDLAAGQKYSERHREELVETSWPGETSRPEVAPPEGSTIIEAYLLACKRMSKYAACADHLSGVLSYQKMRRAVIALAVSFQSIEKKHVGVLLPATSAAYIVILALLLAGKVPVMLNWTLGTKFLNDTLEQTDADLVISSWKFLEKLSYVEFGEITEKIAYLEDYKKNLSFSKKCQTLYHAMKPTAWLLRTFGAHQIKKEDVAVVLFTSGTEAVPKGVPLTHENILSNERSALKSLSVNKDDIVLGVLPVFHSFGLSVTGLFPILSGIRTAFYPDPTDSFAIIHGLQRWKATIFAAPPSFLRSVLHLAQKEELRFLRLLISGAEKPSSSLLDQVTALRPSIDFVQGYGITECSPVVSMNEQGKPWVGLGKPISCLSCATVHPDTKEPLPPGEEGELCVSGPSVFSGYLHKQTFPFVEFSGKRWYLTGDLGRIDVEGNLILSGRLKRFAKIGGEMVSLGAVEEALSSQLSTSDSPPLAVSFLERQGNVQLVLFSTLDLALPQINALLRKAGFSRLVKIKSIHKLGEMPLTGTGKIDYRKLQSLYIDE
ncbi:MAG: AMP-binding protein [Chlamydiota bacterium]